MITAETIAWGKQLSAVATGSVLFTSVWDSDGFAFLLLQDGKQVDAYASRRSHAAGNIAQVDAIATSDSVEHIVHPDGCTG